MQSNMISQLRNAPVHKLISTASPRRRRATGLIAAAILAGASLLGMSRSANANAAFASFQNADFEFTNTGSTSSGLSSTTPSLQAIFEFDENVNADGHSYAADQPIKANVTLSATVNGAASGTHLLDQPVKDGTLTFKDQYGDNLLTVSDFTGDLTGFNGGQTSNLGTDTTLPTSPDTGVYSSDFLHFAPADDVVSSTGLTMELAGTLGVGSGGYLNSFTANADGSFTGALASVPEPTSIGFVAVIGVGMLLRRSRSKIALA